MPDGFSLVRTTNEFTHETTPEGLRRAHRVAKDVWGRLRVIEGLVEFIFEDEMSEPIPIDAGGSVDIPPETPHRVVTHPECRFVVEFYSH